VRLIIAVLLLLFSVQAIPADRDAKIRALMEAQGLLQTFEQQMQYSRDFGRKQGEQVLNQLMAGLNPSPEFVTRFRSATEDFIKDVEPSWTAQDIVDVWAKFYGARFTDQELDALLSHYTSPLGQKEVTAGREALPKFNEHFAALSGPVLERAMKAYIQRLQLIAKDCNCKR
jgi:hypothetical protein